LRVTEGRFGEALTAYLKSDPAEWADVDVRALRAVRLHAGFAGQTAALIQAALRQGGFQVQSAASWWRF